MNELFEGVAVIGLSFVLGGVIMRARAWAAAKGSGSEIARQMEIDALRYARLGLTIGIALTIVGVAGWFVTT
jgi:hypothetical protein